MKVLFRHGLCDHNIENRISCSLDSKSELTEKGKELVLESALELKKNYNWYFRKNSDIKVFCSPLLRTKQTAKILCDTLEIDFDKVIYDERLKEAQYGTYDEGPVSNLPYDVYDMDNFQDHGSETYFDIESRIRSFLRDTNPCMPPQHYTHLIVSHALPIRVMHKMLTEINDKVKVAKYFIVNQ